MIAKASCYEIEAEADVKAESKVIVMKVLR